MGSEMCIRDSTKTAPLEQKRLGNDDVAKSELNHRRKERTETNSWRFRGGRRQWPQASQSADPTRGPACWDVSASGQSGSVGRISWSTEAGKRSVGEGAEARICSHDIIGGVRFVPPWPCRDGFPGAWAASGALGASGCGLGAPFRPPEKRFRVPGREKKRLRGIRRPHFRNKNGLATTMSQRASSMTGERNGPKRTRTGSRPRCRKKRAGSPTKETDRNEPDHRRKKRTEAVSYTHLRAHETDS